MKLNNEYIFLKNNKYKQYIKIFFKNLLVKEKKILNNLRIIIGGGFLFVILILTIFAPYLISYSPNDININDRLISPNFKHLFGTDAFGRDLLSRVIYGGRVSLFVGIISTILIGIFGTIIGITTGYYKRVEMVVMRIMDAMMSFPSVLLALALISIFGPGTMKIIYALTIVYIPRCARVVRASTIYIKSTEFVEAARSLGYSEFRILTRHILPNCINPLIIQLTVTFANAILSEAGLSFLGLGPSPPTPSWGSILSDARVLIWNAPWISFFPGIAIFLTVLSLNILGDGLRDILDPRLKK